ncbi:MAG: hypothetical protein LBG71_02455 [Clostridiales Family XIII bacterium]|jgi:hypothetical protein|nr:hypothetical protein [Clostridiales Family XIII bacterium]
MSGEKREAKTLALSPLGHTWILDLDGTLVKHNGYKTDGHDTLLAGAREFLESIPPGDMVVVITSRGEEDREATGRFLAEQGVRHDHIIYGAPLGERILLNDRKPSGLATAVAVNVERDGGPSVGVVVDGAL